MGIDGENEFYFLNFNALKYKNWQNTYLIGHFSLSLDLSNSFSFFLSLSNLSILKIYLSVRLSVCLSIDLFSLSCLNNVLTANFTLFQED